MGPFTSEPTSVCVGSSKLCWWGDYVLCCYAVFWWYFINLPFSLIYEHVIPGDNMSNDNITICVITRTTSSINHCCRHSSQIFLHFCNEFRSFGHQLIWLLETLFLLEKWYPDGKVPKKSLEPKIDALKNLCFSKKNFKN